MDLFNQRKLAQLREDLAEADETNSAVQARITSLEAKTRALANQVEYLVRTIRQTDDIIFSISQCVDWESMRPRVAQLTDQMTARKVAESNRIGDLLRGELIETYAPGMAQKRLK